MSLTNLKFHVVDVFVIFYKQMRHLQILG